MSFFKPNRSPALCRRFDAIAMRPDEPALPHHWWGVRGEVEPAGPSTNLIIQPSPVE